ncbi:MAG: ABC transporter ATP-binding protein/permease [Christensenellaceae bacterium]|nr:ABC transporter ATP-binding protein/permease [Christensenellaceae bacterium]
MFKRFFEYFHKYKRYLYLSAACVIIETVFEMLIPVLMTDIIDVGLPNKDQAFLLSQGLLMLLFALISMASGILYARWSAIAGIGFASELREAEFSKFMSFSFLNTDHFTTASLVTRLTNDITVLQTTICGGMRPIVRGPIMFVVAIVTGILVSPALSVVFFIAIPVLSFFLFLIVRKQRFMFRRIQQSLDRVNSFVQENLAAIRVVKSYVRGDYQCEKFDEINQEHKAVATQAFHYSVLNQPLFQFVMYATTIALLLLGGVLVRQNRLAVGQLTMFLSYVLMILNSLMLVSAVFLMFSRSAASASRIAEVLDEIPDIQDASDPALKVAQGSIDFDHVYFKYTPSADEYVLSDISLHIHAGQTIGIIGGTGSAKTSLVQLIPRLYDISSGSLKIDGRDIKEYAVAHLREAVGMVLQKNTLFSGTVRDNLQWGDENASDADIMWACRIASADAFINAMPKRLDTQLGQGGVNVSGGQKQRLCIARALLKKPRILILDDTTSAVDTATEANIRAALAECMPHTTKLIISQRLSSVEGADQIVILDNGTVKDIGTHEELLKRSAYYRDIVETQKKGQEA